MKVTSAGLKVGMRVRGWHGDPYAGRIRPFVILSCGPDGHGPWRHDQGGSFGGSASWYEVEDIAPKPALNPEWGEECL